jgi:SAM-dependent methyltransferase
VDACHEASADWVRSQIERGLHEPSPFREALLRVPPTARDAWVDRVFGLVELPDDGPALPRDCVPYLPCGVDALLRIVEQASVGPSDVFVDVGSGVGRATALVHLLTGAAAIGLEVQPALVAAARELAMRLALQVSTVEGDATELTHGVTTGSVFFLYCPFSGNRLGRVLAGLEAIARTRTIRVCCVDLPLPPCRWLMAEPPLAGDVAVYRSEHRQLTR